MNIVHLMNEFWYGGIQETVLTLCQGMPEHRHFVLGHTDGPMRETFGSEKNVFYISTSWDKEYSGLDRFIKNNDIDIVHKQMGGGDTSDMLQQLRHPEKLCTVVESVHCPRACKTPYDLVDFVCVASMYTMAHQELYKDRNNISVVHYGCDIPKPNKSREEVRDSWGIPQDAFIVGRIGRLSGSKLVHDTAYAANIANETIPNFHCIIGGAIPNDEGPSYSHNLVEKFGNHPNIHFIGEVDTPEDRASILQALDVCCYPTQGEGFGMIFLEAIHQGLPIITYDNGANAEVVGEAGWSIKYSEDISDRVNRLAEKLHQIYDMRENLPGSMNEWKARVRDRGKAFTVEAYADRMREVYNNEYT